MRTYTQEDIDFSSYDQVMELYESFQNKCDEESWTGFLGIQSKSEFESCYLLSKPVTMMEVIAPENHVNEFSEKLEDYFYTCVVQESEVESETGDYHQLYISRFKSLIDVAEQFLDQATDRRADLAGVLFGYRPVDVAGYCDERSDHLFK